MSKCEARPLPSSAACDIVVIGAGFAGLYAVYAARRMGYNVICVEAAGDVGGTWYFNRYPGCRCDVESIDYSFSFDKELQRDWRWSERYATQPEILRYINHVTDRFKLRPHIRFNERVLAARFDEDIARWQLTTDQGAAISARWVISAVGSLSTPIKPNIPGIDDFSGTIAYTATWPRDGVDVAGKKVAVIGTGSSAIQSIPIFAESAERVTVFQRSANYSVPVFNRELTDADWEAVQENYPARRRKSLMSGGGSPHEAHPEEIWKVAEEERRELFEKAWKNGGVLFAKVFPNQTADKSVNDVARSFVEDKIRSIVKDPQVAEDLMPQGHAIGTKRICTDSGYYEAFNRDNVELVNLRRTPIVRVTPTGIETSEGAYDVDVLVIATGFDAMTGSVLKIDFQGPRGKTMSQAWADGPITLLGLGIPGLPNLFNITGPGSPSVLANMVMAAEQQVDWTLELIRSAEESCFTTAEAREDAAHDWTKHVGEVADKTLFTVGNSWYLGANVEGKKRVFMPYIGGLGTYVTYCDKVRADGYTGFIFSS